MRRRVWEIRNSIIVMFIIACYCTFWGIYSFILSLNESGFYFERNISLPLLGGGVAGLIIAIALCHVDERIGIVLSSVAVITAAMAHGTNSPGRIVLFLNSAVIQTYGIVALLETYRSWSDSRFRKKIKQRFEALMISVKWYYAIVLLSFLLIIFKLVAPGTYGYSDALYVVGGIFILSSIMVTNPLERAVRMLTGCSFIVTRIGCYMQMVGDKIEFYILPSLTMIISILLIVNYRVFGLKKAEKFSRSIGFYVIMFVFCLIAFIATVLFLYYRDRP